MSGAGSAENVTSSVDVLPSESVTDPNAQSAQPPPPEKGATDKPPTGKICGISKKLFFIILAIFIVLVIVLVIVIVIVFCTTSEKNGNKSGLTLPKKMSKHDPNSFSNADEIWAESYHFDWNVDFQNKILSGTVIYKLLAKTKDVKQIIFDTRSDLKVKSAKSVKDKKVLNQLLGESRLSYGKPLVVQLPALEPAGDMFRAEIELEFESTPAATGLLWLSPEQSTDGKHPFLFSQNEAINARSMFPCQDTPFTKATFTAQVRAPKELVVLMGAVADGQPMSDSQDSSKRIHKWTQSVPIPSYLVAIAVGNLVSKDLGPKGPNGISRVWADPSLVEAAAKDFEDTEEVLRQAESISGKYVWERYDLLILPSSFPYGGMEHPCLTFLSPALITGDKSLLNVVAHEISHSWSGNLVTNQNFEHFWLNEGFTVFLERKILEKRSPGERDLTALQGYLNLQEVIKESPAYTELNVDLTDADPDDTYSIAPYEKGSLFLYYLEKKIGKEQIMDKFLKKYFEKFARKSIVTEDWRQYFIQVMKEEGKEDAIKDIDWDTWLKSPGNPPHVPDYDQTLYKQCVDLRDKWVAWDVAQPNPFKEDDLSKFSPTQQQIFVQLIIDSNQTWSLQKMQEMGKLYKLESSKNVEILFRWVRCTLRSDVGWKDKLDLALKIVTDYGRMKYVRPIYRDLYRLGGDFKDRAIQTFEKNMPRMMAVAVNGVKKDLHLDSGRTLGGRPGHVYRETIMGRD